MAVRWTAGKLFSYINSITKTPWSRNNRFMTSTPCTQYLTHHQYHSTQHSSVTHHPATTPHTNQPLSQLKIVAFSDRNKKIVTLRNT
jgi:hypothetical protein